jgi:hypothetical protein
MDKPSVSVEAEDRPSEAADLSVEGWSAEASWLAADWLVVGRSAAGSSAVGWLALED